MKWDFKGLCISDYGAVGNTHGSQHVGETLEDAGLLCLKAGMDMELPNPSGFGEKFLEKFRTGKADISALNRAVLRVLTQSSRMSLFEHPFSLRRIKVYFPRRQTEKYPHPVRERIAGRSEE